jgi:Tfp pilus assembly protein PilE
MKKLTMYKNIMQTIAVLVLLVACDNNRTTTNQDVYENQPPALPSNPSPANSASGLDRDFQLSWECSDPDGDSLTFDVYLGLSPDSLICWMDTQENIYISAWHQQDIGSELLIQIHTAQQAYHQENNTYCLNGATASRRDPHRFSELDIEIEQSNHYTYVMCAAVNTFSCQATENIDNDATIDTWTINQHGVLTNSINDIDIPFVSDTTYYWKIVARDTGQLETTGPVWHFSTVSD